MIEELDLDTALDRLKHQDAYNFVVEYLESLSDGLIDELPDVPADKLQQHAGRITTYREVLAILHGK